MIRVGWLVVRKDELRRLSTIWSKLQEAGKLLFGRCSSRGEEASTIHTYQEVMNLPINQGLVETIP